MKTFNLTLLFLFLFVGLISGDEAEEKTLEEEERERSERFLSFFQIVTFPNAACVGGSKNGTCYTASECSNRGGTNDGSCADGFGVCCTITLGCGQTSAENCTYFDSTSASAGACSARICPCTTNICQLRLDFETFVISGPSTSTITVGDLLGGAIVPTGSGAAYTTASNCLTDTFSVASTGNNVPPVICGTNTGEHMYVDFDAGSNACISLDFQFLTAANGIASTASRSWSIKATQYSCDYSNLAPEGCTQYYFGPTSGTIQSYNYNGGNGGQLANQNQAICIRRERGLCRACFVAVSTDDFKVSGPTGAALAKNSHITCCSANPDTAIAILGADCVMIPGAESAKTTGTGVMVGENICGRSSGLATTAGLKTVCTNQTPFQLRFVTDGFEYMVEHTIALDTGFTLMYTMDTTNCN